MRTRPLMNKWAKKRCDDHQLKANRSMAAAIELKKARIAALRAGEATLVITEKPQPKEAVYTYFTGSTGVVIDKYNGGDLTKVSGINRLEYGHNGFNEYFEVWGGR